MVSDDTEHTVLVGQCLALNPPDAQSFQRMLAWKLRWWLLCAPAGIGFATLRALLKLWVGFPTSRSGVFSAGNGPAMRSAIIGTYFAEDTFRIREYVRASTRLTHTDPRAETAALAVAFTAARAIQFKEAATQNLTDLRDLWISADSRDAAWAELVSRIIEARQRDVSVLDFARELGLERGVTGYAYHTVPVGLYGWLRHFGDYRAGMEAVLNCGGDTDTVGAITGALLAINGPIPAEWTQRLCDYPCSRSYLERLAHAFRLDSAQKEKLPLFLWVVLPLRNLVFFVIVVVHVVGRLIV